MVIGVRATNCLKKLTYQVIGGGSVIQSQTVSTPRTKRFKLSILPREEMFPKSQIIIFYIASNGEMISDKVEVEFTDELKNQVSKIQNFYRIVSKIF